MPSLGLKLRTIFQRFNLSVNWRVCITGLLLMAFNFSFCCRFLVVHISPIRNGGNKQSPPTQPHMGRSHMYDSVQPGGPKGSFVTLLSASQCHTAFGTMPHTLSLVDKSAFRHPRMLPLLATMTPKGWTLKGKAYVLGKCLYTCVYIAPVY
jgi:hypothetical protein